MSHKTLKDEDKLKLVIKELEEHFQERLKSIESVMRLFSSKKVAKDLVSIALMTLVKHDVI